MWVKIMLYKPSNNQWFHFNHTLKCFLFTCLCVLLQHRRITANSCSSFLNPPAKWSFIKICQFCLLKNVWWTPLHLCQVTCAQKRHIHKKHTNTHYWWNCWAKLKIFSLRLKGSYWNIYEVFYLIYLGKASLSHLLCVCLLALLSLTHSELFFTQTMESILKLSKDFSKTEMVSVLGVLFWSLPNNSHCKVPPFGDSLAIQS